MPILKRILFFCSIQLFTFSFSQAHEGALDSQERHYSESQGFHSHANDENTFLVLCKIKWKTSDGTEKTSIRRERIPADRDDERLIEEYEREMWRRNGTSAVYMITCARGESAPPSVEQDGAFMIAPNQIAI